MTDKQRKGHHKQLKKITQIKSTIIKQEIIKDKRKII